LVIHPKIILAILFALIMAASGAFLVSTQSQNPVAGAGNFETQSLQSLASFPKVSQSTTQLESVEVFLIRLKNRLEIEPDDVDGWLLLSKSYDYLDRLGEAKMAFEKAKTLGYTGNWKPLPQIIPARQQSYTSENTPGGEGTSSSDGKTTFGTGIK